MKPLDAIQRFLDASRMPCSNDPAIEGRRDEAIEREIRALQSIVEGENDMGTVQPLRPGARDALADARAMGLPAAACARLARLAGLSPDNAEVVAMRFLRDLREAGWTVEPDFVAPILGTPKPELRPESEWPAVGETVLCTSDGDLAATPAIIVFFEDRADAYAIFDLSTGTVRRYVSLDRLMPGPNGRRSVDP